MHKDFHLYGTYLAARLAGKNADDAKAIAFAAQATDDFTYGEYAACQTPGAMVTEDMNIVKTYWSIFHFLPSGIDTPQAEERKYVTRPEGLLFDILSCEALELNSRSDGYTLAYLGVVMHIIADTFAHKGFSGIPSRLNIVEDLIMCEKQGLGAIWSENCHVPVIFAENIQKARIGHGTAGNAPDLSWITFTYIDADCIDGNRKKRDNAVIFASAFVKLYELLGGNSTRFRDIELKVKSTLCGIRSAADKGREKSYYESNDKSFENMLRQNTLNEAAGFTGKITAAEIKRLTDDYPGYINQVNTLAHNYRWSSGTDKIQNFRSLSENDFFAATIKAREEVMKEIDEEFKVKSV